MDKFWLKEPSIIINNCWEIIPNNNMSMIRKLNAITRLLILFLVLLLLFKRESIYIILVLVFILVIIIFYYMYISDENNIDDDVLASDDEIEEYTPDNFYCPKDGCKINCMDDCPKELKNNKLSETNGPINSIYNDPNYRDMIMKDGSSPNVILEAGYIDSDGNYRLGKEYNLDTPNNNKKKLNYEADKKYKKSKCRKPTADNPYMNVVFSDYLDAANVPEPCNSDQTKDDAQYLYNSTVYRNIEDVYERQNSQRLFYTLPITTIPNKQGEFADWLYKTGPQCKENTSKCTYFEEPYMVSQRY
jgi:Ca2+/Na+ antiporter